MAFSARHYRMVGSVLAKGYGEYPKAVGEMIGAFADLFVKDNERFNPELFISYVEGERDRLAADRLWG